MKKIIRLTESDLMRLVRRVINEQIKTSNGPSKPTDSYKGKTANFYKDKENKMFFNTGQIIDVYSERNGKIRLEINFKNLKSGTPTSSHDEDFIDFVGDTRLKFNCAFSNNGFEEVSGKLNSNVYSNSLSDKLKKDFCMTNKSGVQVPKADFASTNDSQDDSQDDLS